MLLAALLSALCLTAQPAPEVMQVPVLQPGEGFVITLGDGEVRAYGEAKQEAPMGDLAKLVWMRLEGADWTGRNLQLKCTGKAGPFTCRKPEGHGRVDVGKALKENCDLAFLAWIADAQTHWKKDYGDAAARRRMEEVFQPFLGRRLPPGEDLPPLTPVWVGHGDLLRTSPEGFLRWLMEPEQTAVVNVGKRFLAGNWVEMMELFGKEGWWFQAGTAPLTSGTTAWVVGGRAQVLVVLRLPQGQGEREGLARMREILRLKA